VPFQCCYWAAADWGVSDGDDLWSKGSTSASV